MGTMEEKMGKQNRVLTSGATRRSFLQGLGGTTAGLAYGTSAQFVSAQSRDPIRIGCLNTFTKAAAIYGEATLKGLNLYFEEIGWQIAGRKVEIIKEDDEFNPQAALPKVRKFVESDHVQVICGPLASQNAMAMVDYMTASRVPWLVTGAGATALTGKRIPHMYRATLSNWQVAYPMGSWLYKNVAKGAVITASDILAGHDVADAFKESFVKEGGNIIKEIYPPLGTNDFSAYLSDIRSIMPPAIYSFYAGIDAARFVRQCQQFGLTSKCAMVGFQSVYDNETFSAEGRAALGALSSSIYSDLLDTPENKKFVAAYKKRYNELPGIFAESGYTAARIVDEATRAVGGDIEKQEEFAAAVGRLKIIAPRGPVRFDPVTHQAIQNVYIRKVIEIDDHLGNQVVATIRDVGDNPANAG
jgi:branched-chain amino acid transport system substrate-binding protein